MVANVFFTLTKWPEAGPAHSEAQVVPGEALIVIDGLIHLASFKHLNLRITCNTSI